MSSLRIPQKAALLRETYHCGCVSRPMRPPDLPGYCAAHGQERTRTLPAAASAPRQPRGRGRGRR